MNDGYIDIFVKVRRIFCKKHNVLVAGKCPLCKEARIKKRRQKDCERQKRKYRIIKKDPEKYGKMRQHWKLIYKTEKDDPVKKEMRSRRSKQYYNRNKEAVKKRSKINYERRRRDMAWMKARAIKMMQWRLKQKVDSKA